MLEIHDSFELVLNITAIIPCLILTILYLIDFNKLKYPNYFKLELILSFIIYICLNFIKNYDYKVDKENINSDEQTEHESNNCFFKTNLEIIGLIKSYLEIVNLILLASFNYLCYKLLNTKSKDDKKLPLIIILSLISWIIPIYIFIIYFISKKEDSFISISGVCIFAPNLKKQINIYLIPIIFLANTLFFIITLKTLYSRKKIDEDNIKSYNKNIKSITLNYISHFIFFTSQFINNLFLQIDFKINRYKYYNINYLLALTVLCSISCIEGKTREYYKRLIEHCLTFEKNEKEDHEEEEEEDEDDDEDIKIFHERISSQASI